MNSRSSKNGIKTIIFIIVVALSCLLYFGLDTMEKTKLQLVSFCFLMFAVLVIYLSALLPGITETKKFRSSDLISVGVLYAIGNFVINFLISITEMRPLIVLNIAAILIYLLILAVVLLIKKK